jgi:Domain of unknown function (DUF305)
VSTDALMAQGSSMIVPVKLRAALRASGLAGVTVSAFFLAALLLDRTGYRGVGLNDVRSEALCTNGPSASEATFHSEMGRVNARMHAGMRVAPSGNTDRDFARMMIAHHQGAIDLALVQLKHSNNKPLRRLAQSIIVEQGQEITYMRRLLHTNETMLVNDVADR